MECERAYLDRIHSAAPPFASVGNPGIHGSGRTLRWGLASGACRRRNDEPVTAGEYAQLTANLLSLPLPPTMGWEDTRQELSGSEFEWCMAARRRCNRRMREELGVVPRYPSVREGVPSALRAEGAI